MKRWALSKTSQRGFTIVELLIVIVVIALLVAIVVVGYGVVQSNAQDASLKSDLTKFGDAVHLKVLDDESSPLGGATSSLDGDPTILTGVKVTPNPDPYSQSVANLYYCQGIIDGNDEFAFVAKSISGKVFKYISKSGLSEITTPTTWTTTSDPAICTAAGFSAPFTWSYGFNPDTEFLWAPWAEPDEG